MLYRTFNLTVADWDGTRPLPGARIVLRRLVHYDARECVTPENGTIRVERLREGEYEVTVSGTPRGTGRAPAPHSRDRPPP